MKSKYILLILLSGAICILYLTLTGGQSQGYVRQITREREEKDNYMRSAEESPITDKKNFKGLTYFSVSEKYRILAELLPVEEKKVRTLTTSDGKEQHYLEYAHAEFDMDNRKNRLLILEVMEMGPNRGVLFLAFGDETSANETYGAGRYLDLKKVSKGSKTILLDFNKAYNPYCAYSDTFSCPLPPPENLLLIAIRAGEMVYGNH